MSDIGALEEDVVATSWDRVRLCSLIPKALAVTVTLALTLILILALAVPEEPQ